MGILNIRKSMKEVGNNRLIIRYKYEPDITAMAIKRNTGGVSNPKGDSMTYRGPTKDTIRTITDYSDEWLDEWLDEYKKRLKKMGTD